MNETEIYKNALSKQAKRIATLTLDLDLAHAQIELLTNEINELKKVNQSSNDTTQE